MKHIVIVGGGSIGKRHLRNLRVLGETSITVVDPNVERAAAIQKEFGVATSASVEAVLHEDHCDIAFVCSPSVYHMEQSIMLAEHGADLFIEKPLSHNLDGLERLLKIVREKKLITMVGSNWKFYPLFQKIKELLDSGAIGRVLSVRCQFGQYLPDWHPWEDYRHGYSANKKLGGGILLDSHEFDYLTWFLAQPVKSLVCFAGKLSNLEIDVEDTAEVILRFGNGTIGEIHLDYLQRFYQRDFEFFGELGTIVWDTNLKTVVLKNKEKGNEVFPLAPDYDVNTMYIDEVHHFMERVSSRVPTITSVEHGAEVLRLIVAAKTSAARGEVVQL